MSLGKSWLNILVLVFSTSLGLESASAHFPFHRHVAFHRHVPFHHHRYVGSYYPPTLVWGRPYVAWGPAAWGLGCWPRYSSFVHYNVVYPRICYPPVVFNPVVCAPAFCDPVCYEPGVYRPFIHPLPASFSVSVATARTARTTSVQPVVQNRVVAQLIPIKAPSEKAQPVKALTTSSPVWTNSAVGLIDDMMERGDWEVARRSLQRMDSISTPLGHAVLLRRAIFDLVTHSEAIDSYELDRLLDRFNRAAEAGSRLDASELRGNSLSTYLQASSIDLNAILDRLAQRALEQPERSGREMLLLSVLLNLDNQPERATLFANASGDFAARSTAFRWYTTLQAVKKHIERDSLLAAKD